MDIAQLLQSAKSGSPEATRELLLLQRQGLALRLYPEGRSGPEDEGVTPMMMAITDEMLVRITFGRPCTAIYRLDQLGPTLSFLFLAVSRMTLYREQYDPSLISEEFGYTTAVSGDPPQVSLSLRPVADMDYLLGQHDCVGLITDWLTFIDQHEWELDDCGLTENQYAILNDIAYDR